MTELAIHDAPPHLPAVDDLSFGELAARLPPPRDAIVATRTLDTLLHVYVALAARRPLALLDPLRSPDELARERELVAAADLPTDTAFVLFTSGSTDLPRGVALSRAAIVAAAEASAAHLGWRDDDRWLLALSLAHTGGLAIVVRCLVARKPLVLLDERSRRGGAPAAKLAAGLARATIASLVPTQLAALLDDAGWRPPPRLRAVLLGGAAAPPALLAAAAARGVPFLTTYGMTETFGQVATAPLDRAGDPGALPIPLPGVSIAATPRIRVRGPMLATRYLDGAAIAPELETADLGELVGGGLHVLGRADDVIVTGGANVHPAEVEAALTATPGVRATCAFGVPDARWGQVVAAAIVVDARFELAAAAARWHRTLAPHALPRRLAIVDALPCLPSGKLDRRAAAVLPTATVVYRDDVVR